MRSNSGRTEKPRRPHCRTYHGERTESPRYCARVQQEVDANLVDIPESPVGSMFATHFITGNVWTGRGLVTCCSLTVVPLKPQCFAIASLSTNPSAARIERICRHLIAFEDGFTEDASQLIVLSPKTAERPLGSARTRHHLPRKRDGDTTRVLQLVRRDR